IAQATGIADLERLLRLRLVVGRFGEMDIARWWNTNGQLGQLGTSALRRGFPRTHYFAQARSVFAAAAQRCSEVFDPPGCVTLWRLPEAIEEEFDARWEHWLDSAAEWTPFFEQIETFEATDLHATLRSLGLTSERHSEAFLKLRRSAEGRAVPLPGVFTESDDDVALLALGFARGERGALAVPYARREVT
ncbi:MAG: BrxE family protein, partial [Acidimicrobiales bacterium]